MGDLRRRLRATQASDEDLPCDEMVKSESTAQHRGELLPNKFPYYILLAYETRAIGRFEHRAHAKSHRSL
jgi:hypothetical protein